jgi:hypothetical protein
MKVRLNNMPAHQIVLRETRRIEFVLRINVLIIEHNRYVRRQLRNDVVLVEDPPGHDRQFVK